MRVLYVPDGHRRYADNMGLTFDESYLLGYHVLINEVVDPLLHEPDVDAVVVFLLSELNLVQRDRDELAALLAIGSELLVSLIDRFASEVRVRTLGSYLETNLDVGSGPGPRLDLLLGTGIDDQLDCAPVDLFIRSGGGMRLSGVPRHLIGNYTEFSAIPTLHPLLQRSEIEESVDAYRHRYRREGSAAR